MYSLRRFKPYYMAFEASLLILLFCGTTEENQKTFEASKDVCENGVYDDTVKSTCCGVISDEDSITNKCLETSKIGDYLKGEQTGGGSVYVSIFTECVYEKRKFIKSDTELNIGQIKKEAKKKYPKDAQQRKFMINMYRDCGKQATKTMDKYNSDPAKAEILRTLHTPYFSIVYICVLHYSSSKCPYFRWNATPDKLCKKWAADCKKLISAEKAKKLKKE